MPLALMTQWCCNAAGLCNDQRYTGARGATADAL